MFTPLLSWKTFILIYVILLVIYYGVFIILFKRNKIGNISNSFSNGVDSREHIQSGKTDREENGNLVINSRDVRLSNRFNDLVDEIRAYIAEVSSSSFTKQEILQNRSIIIKKYAWLK
jgi:hypothetical protein